VWHFLNELEFECFKKPCVGMTEENGPGMGKGNINIFWDQFFIIKLIALILQNHIQSALASTDSASIPQTKYSEEIVSELNI
jgi:hypothetical protein